MLTFIPLFLIQGYEVNFSCVDECLGCILGLQGDSSSENFCSKYMLI